MEASSQISFLNPSDFIKSPESDAVDFSINPKDRSCTTLCKKILLIALKIILLPWGIYCATRHVMQRLVMIPLYPAQSGIARHIMKNRIDLRKASLDTIGAEAKNRLESEGFLVRRVNLKNNGTTYHGYMIGRPETIDNGKWSIQAVGNSTGVELGAYNAGKVFNEISFNTLLINGPGVGRSGGTATPQKMGEAQEAGLQFLETALKAKKVIIAGHSLGSAAMSMMIQKHEFKPEIKYVVVRQMTFDRVSKAASKMVQKHVKCCSLKWLAKRLVKWTGCEIDSVAASKRLSELKIPEVIAQAVTISRDKKAGKDNDFFIDDRILPGRTSLGYRLHKEGVTDHKHWAYIRGGEHCAPAAFMRPLEIIQSKRLLA